jgi:hypothetical protein
MKGLSIPSIETVHRQQLGENKQAPTQGPHETTLLAGNSQILTVESLSRDWRQLPKVITHSSLCPATRADDPMGCAAGDGRSGRTRGEGAAPSRFSHAARARVWATTPQRARPTNHGEDGA